MRVLPYLWAYIARKCNVVVDAAQNCEKLSSSINYNSIIRDVKAADS